MAQVHFEVPEGHHPRGTTLREALRGNLPLRGFSGASVGVSSRVLRGLRGALQGSAGDFSEGSDPILVTLGNCWSSFPSENALPHFHTGECLQ